jgi:hypothetical protein
MTKETWIVQGHTGVSSKTIWAHFNGCAPDWTSPPMDPSDFLRCYWLLKLAPEWRARIVEVADRHPRWRKVVEAWAELETMLEAAWPKSCRSGEYENEPPANAMYKRMKELGL